MAVLSYKEHDAAEDECDQRKGDYRNFNFFLHTDQPFFRNYTTGGYIAARCIF